MTITPIGRRLQRASVERDVDELLTRVDALDRNRVVAYQLQNVGDWLHVSVTGPSEPPATAAGYYMRFDSDGGIVFFCDNFDVLASAVATGRIRLSKITTTAEQPYIAVDEQVSGAGRVLMESSLLQWLGTVAQFGLDATTGSEFLIDNTDAGETVTQIGATGLFRHTFLSAAVFFQIRNSSDDPIFQIDADASLALTDAAGEQIIAASGPTHETIFTDINGGNTVTLDGDGNILFSLDTGKTYVVEDGGGNPLVTYTG